MSPTTRNKDKKAQKPSEVKVEDVSEEATPNKEEVKEEDTCDEATLKRRNIQSMWKVPAIAQFVSLYRFAFNLPEIEIEDLEDGILDATAVGTKTVLDLLTNIIRSLQPSRKVTPENYETFLLKITNKIKGTGECPNVNLTEEVGYFQLDSESKVDLLYSLCVRRLDSPDILEVMKDMKAETLRVQPLGCDELGNEYWYFYGTRLYKQEASRTRKKNWQEEWTDQKNQSFGRRGRGRPKKNSRSSGGRDDFVENTNTRYMNVDEKSRWSVACNTIEDWVNFAEKLKKSTSKCEKALFLTITDNFLPVLNEIYQEKERKFQEKLRELIPKFEPRRMETRRMTRKATEPDMTTDGDENTPKEDLARNRALRLEGRNRRSQRLDDRSSSRSRRRSTYYDDYVDDVYEDYDEGLPQNASQNILVNASPERSHQYTPLTSTDGNDLKSKVLHVLSEVKLQKDAWPFLYPVDESYAPGYYEIIQNPMDLQTLSKKLLENAYKTVSDIDRDFEQMVSNCKLYNGEHSDMAKMVMNLWKVFRKGLTKAFRSEVQEENNKSASEFEPPAKTQHTSYDSDSQDSSNEKQVSQPLKKHKKSKSYHREALNLLSKEAEKAVEESQQSPDFMQIDTRELSANPTQYSMYSDLKIIPINNHSSSLIEKFSSDSSNQEENDLESSLDGAPRYLNDDATNSVQQVINETAIQEPQVQTKRSTPTIHYMSQIGSDFSDLINKPGVSSNVAGNTGAPNELNTSFSSLSSTSPGLSGQERNSSPQTHSPQNVPVIQEQNPPALQSSYSLNELSNFTSSFETSTVNAAALGLPSSLAGFRRAPVSNTQVPMTTSYAIYSQAPISTTTVQAPVRPNPDMSMPPQMVQNQLYQGNPATTQYFQPQKSSIVTTFCTTHPSQAPIMVSNAPVQSSRAFADPGNVVLQPQGENKFPNLKFSLPPSTGEILLVPGDPASSGMTFHLFAQPTANPTQPIQSTIELKPDNASSTGQQFHNQQATNTVQNQVLTANRINRQETVIRPQKRKSPHLEQQDPTMQTTPATTSLPYPGTAMPKMSNTTEMAPSTQTVYASNPNMIMRPDGSHQRPVHNQYDSSRSAFQPRAKLVPMRNSVPFPTSSHLAQRTSATVIPSVFSTASMTTTSAMARSNMTVKTVQIPNGVVQNAGHQLIYLQPAGKESNKRPLVDQQTMKTQSFVGKTIAQAVTSAQAVQSANTNPMMQSSPFQNGQVNPPQMYAQVVPSQMQPQFINNNPYYIIADPNAFQGAQRFPVVNMQPIPFTNR